jgi:hypothetical protein
VRLMAAFRVALASALLLVSAAGLALDPDATPDQIRAEMARIRRTTNWNDAAAAKAATDQIAKLAKQLTAALRRANGNPPAGGSPATGDAAVGTGGPSASRADESSSAGSKADLVDQILGAAQGGKNAPIDLARNVRRSVEEELKEEQEEAAGVPTNPAYMAEIDVLVIDFSQPGAETLAAQLDKYTMVKTLVLTGGARAATVQLDDVLSRAAALPLETLYIIDFRDAVTSIPDRIASFRDLSRLGLFNNAIAALPPSIGGLPRLAYLYVDKNPLPTLMPTIASLKGLVELGVAKTEVSAGEIAEIRRLLPRCRVMS